MIETNWLGQELGVGTVVYRGARDGNTSSFKIGIIRKMSLDKAPRVEWIAEQSTRWVDKGIDHTREIYARELTNSFGSPSIDSLIVVNPNVLRNLGFSSRI